jgi:hypothetical protein
MSGSASARGDIVTPPNSKRLGFEGNTEIYETGVFFSELMLAVEARERAIFGKGQSVGSASHPIRMWKPQARPCLEANSWPENEICPRKTPDEPEFYRPNRSRALIIQEQ